MPILLGTTGILVIVLVVLSISCNGVPIIGGDVAERGQFNYQVMLLMKGANICGGSIIGDNLVLSAGHCFEDVRPYQVHVYSSFVSTNHEDGNQHFVRRIYVHDFYKSIEEYRTEWDVALVKIWGSFLNYPNTAIIPLPTRDVQPGDMCKFSGWGRTSTTNDSQSSPDLMWSYGVILNRIICKDRKVPIYYYEFCFIHQHNEATFFLGDSGGPFVCNGVLTGVLVSTTGNIRAPAIAVSVFDILDFIEGVKNPPSGWCTIL